MRLRALALIPSVLLASCALVEEEALLEPSVVTVVQPPAPDAPEAPALTVPTSEPCATLLAVDDPETGTLSEAQIATRYSEIVTLIPEELRGDLETVIAGLRAEVEVTPSRELVMDTTSTSETANPTLAADPGASDVAPEVLTALDGEPDAEGRAPDLLPVDRIAAYVEDVCRGVANNPGPPPGTAAGGAPD